MKKIVLFVFMSTAFLTSCKEEQTKPTDETTTEVKQDTLFTIRLNATVLKNDSFQVYYKSEGEEKYIEEKSLFTEFSGSDKPQDIVFRLPNGIIPDYIRLDFGTNKDQDPIKINSFKMSYYGKDFMVDGKEFFNYLLVEKVTADYDAETGVITPKNINGVHDPQATSEMGLFEQIQKIVK